MATISIILDRRTRNSQGLSPIKVQISNCRTHTTVSTKMFTSEQVFLGRPDRAVDRNTPNAEAINAQVQQVYLQYLAAVRELEHEGRLQHSTATAIRDYVRKKNEPAVEPATLTSEMEKYITNCRAEKTKGCYRYALAHLQEYMRKKVVTFDEMTYSELVGFDRALERQGLSINSRAIIFRNIRTVFNVAIKADILAPTVYPFRKFSIKHAVKEKEHLTLADMQTLTALQLHGNQRTALDFFFLSFFLCGVNPIDLYNMLKPNRHGDLIFVRQKIAHTQPQPVHVHVQPEAQQIIDRYAGDTHLLYFAEKHDFTTFFRRMSKNLADIGNALGLHLHYYMARYTWATLADNIGISHDIISKALGHTDTSTAEKYYISFNWERAHNANRQVIDYLLNIHGQHADNHNIQ